MIAESRIMIARRFWHYMNSLTPTPPVYSPAYHAGWAAYSSGINLRDCPHESDISNEEWQFGSRDRRDYEICIW